MAKQKARTIGSAIKELREALGGLSQERFAHKLATTTRTVQGWEAAEALSPRILSRLHAIAVGVGARDAADFFESKIREVLDWEPEISEGRTRPVAPETERACSRNAPSKSAERSERWLN
jgi:transcriptional regulator with XRE-family HTH domain